MVKITSFILLFLLTALHSQAQVTPAETVSIAVKYLRADISDGHVPFFAKRIIKEENGRKTYIVDPLSLYTGCLGVIFVYTDFKEVLLEKEYASETNARTDLDAMLVVIKQLYPLIKLSSTKTGTGADPIKFFVSYAYFAENLFGFTASIKEQPDSTAEKRYKMQIEIQL